MRPPAKPWVRATPSASRSSSSGHPSPFGSDNVRNESHLVRMSPRITLVVWEPSVLIAPKLYTAILHASPRNSPKLKVPNAPAPPSAEKRLRIAAGRLLKVLAAVPLSPAVFSALAVIVIGPNGAGPKIGNAN